MIVELDTRKPSVLLDLLLGGVPLNEIRRMSKSGELVSFVQQRLMYMPFDSFAECYGYIAALGALPAADSRFASGLSIEQIAGKRAAAVAAVVPIVKNIRILEDDGSEEQPTGGAL